MNKHVIHGGIEFVVVETEGRYDIHTPFYGDLVLVTVFKPDPGRRAEVGWVSIGVATVRQVREVGNALLLAADIADTLDRGISN
jgi:hypothetical protein